MVAKVGKKIEISHAVKVKAVFIILPREAGTGRTQRYNVLVVLMKFPMGT